MSPVSPVFHTEETVSMGLKNKLRVGIIAHNSEHPILTVTTVWNTGDTDDI